MSNSDVRLIEVAFPLKQASLDSVHEKNVRHGHISTLHIWPARRPLAACRAALIATLLPDPGNDEERRDLLKRLGGTVVEVVKKKHLPSGRIEEVKAEETVGGVLHWGREASPDMDWFRAKIRAAYGGRAPKVLDPFAGGGAIPLEAMRLGCEVTASDINPVAWFILKCTLEYPQKLAGQKRPLPGFILKNRIFMEEFFKAQGLKGAMLRSQLAKLGLEETSSPMLTGMTIEGATLEADLAWHVRAWGHWVLDHAREELAQFYPTYADFETLEKGEPKQEAHPSCLVPLRPDGMLDLNALNGEFDQEYLREPRNPRWVPKPTVAYLWARTVACKACRATLPLLKTRWLCKKPNKRVVLAMEPNAERTGVTFDIQEAPQVGANAAQRREHDKRIGAGTMSRSGATCACCGAINTMDDIRIEGLAGRLDTLMTTVVTDGSGGKEYRRPTEYELETAEVASGQMERLYSTTPFGIPLELLPTADALGFRVPLYGFDRWYKLFSPRQLLALGTFVEAMRHSGHALDEEGYAALWIEAIRAYGYSTLARLADRNSQLCTWQIGAEKIGHTFARFALPITWDFVEVMPWSDASGGFLQAVDWVGEAAEHLMKATIDSPAASVSLGSATRQSTAKFDVIMTDPPYYDAIPYSDLMDFFYIWLRRTMNGASTDIDEKFSEPLSPKWDHTKNDGELIDDASRFEGNGSKSKEAYEEGMSSAFRACHDALQVDGRLVVVFAHKTPDAWETLVSAIIRAGFAVDGSWPIQTERVARTRSISSAALSSSIWLVCKKRPETARSGWDNRVLEEMRENITKRLRDFWDAGIRGPDFVWAATGPALEAFSKHPVVRKATEPGQLMTVSEFLGHVRRIVVDFVVGRVLSLDGGAEAAGGLDDVTSYYLLHRHDFGMDEAPIGACILYAVSCGLSDRALIDQLDLLAHSGGASVEGDEAPGEDAEGETDEVAGNTVKLKPWHQRKRASLGYETAGRPVPLIDQVHRLLHLWRAGSVIDVDAYLEERALRRNALFPHLLQALIELAAAGSDERSLLEKLSNHLVARGMTRQHELPI